VAPEGSLVMNWMKQQTWTNQPYYLCWGDGLKKMFQHQRPEEVKTSLFSWSSNGENGLLSTSLLRCFFLALCDAMATGSDTGATLPTSKINTTLISINRWF